eukprot:Hpha_TRINITY_DN15918_c1_g4::TRINITY_DN15918_c1_g4_i1::g.72136::m.72136/K12373/HEXA_B; hexosaminidase
MKRVVLSAAFAVAVGAAPSWPTYSALNLWPMPVNVTYPSAPLGPHLLDIAKVSFDTDGSCGTILPKLYADTLGLKTRFIESTRTYNAKPYAQPDSFCPAARRCGSDADCTSTSQTRCVAPDYLRWNSTHPCPPSTKYGVPCGCCTTPSLPTIPTIAVTCKDSSIPAEGYEMDVEEGGVKVRASTPKGAAYAASTLTQVMRWEASKGGFVVDFVPLKFKDAPVHPYRGVMVDTSRHFVPVDTLIATIDAMYAAKQNIFHWHIIDSPSFPYGSTLYPELAREGSWGLRNDTIYHPADIKRLIDHAESRFVDVMIELDTPAHTMAMGRSHPEIMTDCWEWMANSGYKVDVDSVDCQALNPTVPAAKKIVTDLIAEAAALSNSKYFHVGGDEVKYPCWDSDPSVKSYVAAHFGGNYEKLQADWTANVSMAAAVKAGKTPVCWQPTTNPSDAVWKDALPKDTVYMIWLNNAAAVGYAQQNKSVVMTLGLYVDGMGSGAWSNVYHQKLIPDGLTPAEEKNILGGSVCAWGEQMATAKVTLNTVTIGAGAAENFWRALPDSASDKWATESRYNHFLCHVQRFGVDPGQVMPSTCEVL